MLDAQTLKKSNSTMTILKHNHMYIAHKMPEFNRKTLLNSLEGRCVFFKVIWRQSPHAKMGTKLDLGYIPLKSYLSKTSLIIAKLGLWEAYWRGGRGLIELLCISSKNQYQGLNKSLQKPKRNWWLTLQFLWVFPQLPLRCEGSLQFPDVSNKADGL